MWILLIGSTRVSPTFSAPGTGFLEDFSTARGPSGLRWVWRNGRGPHLEGRQEPQASSPFRTATARSLLYKTGFYKNLDYSIYFMISFLATHSSILAWRIPWTEDPGRLQSMGSQRFGNHGICQCMKVKSESEVAQSCPTLCDPMDCSLPGSSVHGILQARILEDRKSTR